VVVENFRKSQDEEDVGKNNAPREAVAFRNMRSNAQEEMIQRAEYGASPALHVTHQIAGDSCPVSVTMSAFLS